MICVFSLQPDGHEAHLPPWGCADRISLSPIMGSLHHFVFSGYYVYGNHLFVSVEWFDNALKSIVFASAEE